MKNTGLILSCVIGLGISVMANEPSDPGARPPRVNPWQAGVGEGGDMMMLTLTRPAVVKQLNLSGEQQAQIAAVMNGSSNEMSALRAKMQSLARKQAELMGAETLDETAILTLTDEIGDVRSSMARAQVKQMLAVRKVLTAEQRMKMRAMMKKALENREGPGGKRREGRPAAAPKAGAPVPPPEAPAPPPPEAG